ncbi:MAG: hypothetical protein I3273_01875 [Candidatus Moeniiplasma glomeromycotorum]|nr:hypothetical protein [Candidatus Moeniiplasma glomeromycotorum]MCE8167132.1 hypothetical protein [Candidatus Moeniiplasma glomeromycotorum]MCE8168856.1 hypothetical protein [Candidatus Moeniiplasma glomeromycotorum]
MKKKRNLLPAGLKLIVLAALLHFFGVLVTFFAGGKKVVNFNLILHLLRFFSWWSVHTSILTIWAAILVFREREKSVSYFSQFITFLAVIYNLITFFFWIYCLFFLSVGWENSWFLNIQSVLWHVAAPLATLVYFYFYAWVVELSRKLVKTLLFAFISPLFYFFYVWILAKINVGASSSLFPYIEKYPYRIFELIVEREWNWFIVNSLASCLVYFLICCLIIWTKWLGEKVKTN